jgi:hypothetical protein
MLDRKFSIVASVLLFVVTTAVQAVPISRVIIDFDQTAGPRFALDDLATDFTTLHFDSSEATPQPVNGLTVNGITFGFTVGGLASNDAVYNTTTGPGNTSYIHTPNLEGDASGILQLDFTTPTSSLSFGLALLANSTGIGATVQLFDAGLNSVGTLPVNVAPISSVTEGQFSYPSEVPEPATLALMGLGLAGLGFARKKKQA